MYVKRLEAGRFKLPSVIPNQTAIPWVARSVMMVEGIQENRSRAPAVKAERKEYHV